jgi:hypothetical protein
LLYQESSDDEFDVGNPATLISIDERIKQLKLESMIIAEVCNFTVAEQRH